MYVNIIYWHYDSMLNSKNMLSAADIILLQTQMLFLGEMQRVALSPIAIVGSSVRVYASLVDSTTRKPSIEAGIRRNAICHNT